MLALWRMTVLLLAYALFVSQKWYAVGVSIKDLYTHLACRAGMIVTSKWYVLVVNHSCHLWFLKHGKARQRKKFVPRVCMTVVRNERGAEVGFSLPSSSFVHSNSKSTRPLGHQIHFCELLLELALITPLHCKLTHILIALSTGALLM